MRIIKILILSLTALILFAVDSFCVGEKTSVFVDGYGVELLYGGPVETSVRMECVVCKSVSKNTGLSFYKYAMMDEEPFDVYSNNLREILLCSVCSNNLYENKMLKACVVSLPIILERCELSSDKKLIDFLRSDYNWKVKFYYDTVRLNLIIEHSKKLVKEGKSNLPYVWLFNDYCNWR